MDSPIIDSRKILIIDDCLQSAINPDENIRSGRHAQIFHQMNFSMCQEKVCVHQCINSHDENSTNPKSPSQTAFLECVECD